jgi:hypothetical protein
MGVIYNKNRKKGLFYIPSGGLGPSVSADFAYSKSSFNQGEADPTPTITGTPGGSFNATVNVVFVDTGTFNSSTGQIDLSATSIGSHSVAYIVDGVSTSQAVGVTAIPYQSTSSFTFDGINDFFDTQAIPSDFDLPYDTFTESDFSISFWYNFTANENNDPIIQASQSATNGFGVWQSSTNTNSLNFWVGRFNSGALYTTQLNSGNWYHIACVFEGGNPHTQKIYVDGILNNSVSYTTNRVIQSGKNIWIGGQTFQNRFFSGKLDELSIWNTALSQNAVTEIALGPNDLTSLSNASNTNLKAWYKF